MLHYWSRFVVCWMCRVPWAFGSLQHPMARQVGMPFVEYLCSLLGLMGMVWHLFYVWMKLHDFCMLIIQTTSLFPPVLSFFFQLTMRFLLSWFWDNHCSLARMAWTNWLEPEGLPFHREAFWRSAGARCRSWRSLGLQLLSNCVGNSQLSGSLGARTEFS